MRPRRASSSKPQLLAAAGLLACAGALWAADPVPPSKPSQDEILARWADALGGRARLAALRSIHLVARITLGEQRGRFETWYDVRGARRDVLDMPGFRQEIVFDGTRGWVRDTTGKVYPLAGTELENQVTSAYQATYAWLVAGRLPGDVALTGESASPPGYVFVLRPRGGTPYTVVLDRRTFLPAQVTQRTPQGRSVQTMGDWRAVGGILFPWSARQSDGQRGEAGPAVEFAVESIEFDPTIDPAMFSEPPATPNPQPHGR